MTWHVMPETLDLVSTSTHACNNKAVPCYFVTIATVFNNANQHINVYGDDIEVDYRGYEVKGFQYSQLFLSVHMFFLL